MRLSVVAVLIVFSPLGLAAPKPADIDRLLNWGEASYPALLTPAATSRDEFGYRYRCYGGGTTLCLGVNEQSQLHLYQNGQFSNLGNLSDWLRTADRDQIENGKVFPRSLAASAPTRQDKNGFAATFAALSYRGATTRIDALLTGAATGLGSFDPNLFLAESMDAACFGPTMQYSGHPDAASGGPSSGMLPRGDLGLWKEVDTPTGDACAAAQLNAQMDGVSMRGNMAMIGLAVLLRQAYVSGKGLPAAGASVDLLAEMNALGSAATFSKATLSLDSSGKTWRYGMEFSFTDGSGQPHTVYLQLDHTPGGSPSAYQGLLTYGITQQFQGGTCGSGNNPVTRIGTFKYQRADANISSILRQGQYCGHGSPSSLGAFQSDGQLDPSLKWSDSFMRFGANYDPSTQKGKYLSAWQAGLFDPNSRILQLGINGIGSGTSNDGESYYGYGAPLSSSDGKILGFYCNWAGPKPASPVGLHKEYAQRQFLRYNASSGKWEQPSGGANIRYAPTDACTNTSGSFWYDRNLDNLNNETSTDLLVSTPDLFGLGSSSTIAEAIAARGYVIPAF
ncbi:hypothetical protein [Chitinimonas lacunae]|uniref:Uncharacterized protein n=1 Tax=Chitinimonas lacunae TaxID=1963018 RepID=A0ABV8MNA9_9NEIS